MNITGKTIPHESQQYATVGDWRTDAAGLTAFTVSDMDNELYERLVFLHEFVEQTLCLARGISEESVTAFDVAYEAARTPENLEEPGDDERAPYRAEHCFATGIERQFAAECGVVWADYEKAVMGL